MVGGGNCLPLNVSPSENVFLSDIFGPKIQNLGLEISILGDFCEKKLKF